MLTSKVPVYEATQARLAQRLRNLSWCREGESNPHDRKGRRILSLFFAVLQ